MPRIAFSIRYPPLTVVAANAADVEGPPLPALAPSGAAAGGASSAPDVIVVPNISASRRLSEALFLTSSMDPATPNELVVGNTVVAGTTTSGSFDFGVVKRVHAGICVEHDGYNAGSLLWRNYHVVTGPLADYVRGRYLTKTAARDAELAHAEALGLDAPPPPVQRTDSLVSYGGVGHVDTLFWTNAGIEVPYRAYRVGLDAGFEPLSDAEAEAAGAADWPHGGAAYGGAAYGGPPAGTVLRHEPPRCPLHEPIGPDGAPPTLWYTPNSRGEYGIYAPTCTCGGPAS